MSRMNLFSKEELELFNKKYIIQVQKDFYTVTTSNLNRPSYHKFSEKIKFRSQGKFMTIYPETVQMWVKHFKDTYSVFEVQNCINTLKTLYQDIDKDSVKHLLERNHTKIITI